MRRILVTSALPYANGPLHFGHILEAVQTDIWVRAMRQSGHEVRYVCADDTHGTPIMLKAQAEGVTPEALIAGIETEHRNTYRDFLIDHACFHSTHSAENRECTERLYQVLNDAGHITRRTIRQAYDETAQMFLPDRYVKGTCPRCEAADQYGDSCEVCGATYSPSDLKNPLSVISGTTPVERDSEHLFFRLGEFETMLREWTRSGAIHPSVANKLDEWFNAGLRDWDISRDAPYFGFEIPGHPGKYFYVWLDAPVGYMAASLALARRDGLDFDAWWAADSSAELHHFIGKDILYFHTLFWPAVLQGAGLRRPTRVHAHGFLTVNGQKMSKSRGTFITGRRYLERLPPEPLRYYFAAKLGPGIDDMDLSLDDFVSRFNADVVGKVVNIASRCAGFIARAGGQLAPTLPEPALYAEFAAAAEPIAALYEQCDFAAAIREIAALADRANQYIDAQKPWNLAKDPARAQDVVAVCTQGINLFRVLMTFLAPVLPVMAERAGRFLGQPVQRWSDVATPLLGTALAQYEPLATRLDPKVVATLVEDVPAVAAAVAPPAAAAVAAKPTPAVTAAPPPAPAAPTQGKAEVTIDDFAKLDLRVGTVLEADLVDGSDKLLRLQIDLGGGDVRQIFSGIRESYTPQAMLGRRVVVIANLKPRKMRFGLSQGMVLCASSDQPGVYLVSPDEGGLPGMSVN